MEKKQYEVCLAVLKRLSAAGILKDILLIGSWCIPFYKEYFTGVKYRQTIRTRDMDFLIVDPRKIQKHTDIPNLLRDIGFVVGYRGKRGHLKLEHPELVVEFLVPEKGKGTDKPVPLPMLGVNAVALRFLNLLDERTIKVGVEGIVITMPHPANFALHKLIIFQRRLKKDKAVKDREAAVKILRALVQKGEVEIIKQVFDSMLPKWRKKVVNGLEETKERDILNILQPKN